MTVDDARPRGQCRDRQRGAAAADEAAGRVVAEVASADVAARTDFVRTPWTGLGGGAAAPARRHGRGRGTPVEVIASADVAAPRTADARTADGDVAADALRGPGGFGGRRCRRSHETHEAAVRGRGRGTAVEDGAPVNVTTQTSS